ncbi:uncharacterized protein MELLADRAFT_77690 [Melampsora larici-populina 98AG31]|uniref:Uncharacterized protein n=1 Tax=Melampsora larici-populina (strain 98AG31 / pathotype 3-4-7) TaxID=747676 RepID=F4RKK5_MELLP|nr:uncharacterized protein MELLADRAFT_77690 [Melampsora larici-populina 98AG31]EGG07163.1 hypothetical protein MELLADRAFT_77690 [Melampsora larici-populina 98AG31]
MDSLHPSLSTALPLHGYDAEQVLQAPFRAAALGIATFYKRATENGRKAYSLGYAAALQDVLEYLQAGLDHGTDLPRPQRSEQRMALTIERVMDYIERRQEALRAESADSGEDEAMNHSNYNAQQTRFAPSTSSTASTVPAQASQPKDPARSPAPNDQASNPQASVRPPSVSTSTQSLAPQPGESTRRTSPRRPTPPHTHSLRPASAAPAPRSTGSSSVPPTSTSTLTTQTVISPSTLQPPPTINYNFSPATPFPPQFHPHHQSQHVTNSSNAILSRRIRGTTEGRKGKAKERVTDRERSTTSGGTDLVSSVVELLPESVRNPEESFRKRRYPIDHPTSPSQTRMVNMVENSVDERNGEDEDEDVGNQHEMMMDVVNERPSKRHATIRRPH